jgi:hypothetical protein
MKKAFLSVFAAVLLLSNVMHWIKKAHQAENPETIPTIRVKTVEMDGLYWFLECKPRTETRENIYIMTMVSREPRQIIGHVVTRDKTSNCAFGHSLQKTPPCIFHGNLV